MRIYNQNKGLPKNGYVTDLPPQALPSYKKNKQWEKDTMDALERIGVRQISENSHLTDVYRMIRGELSYMEAKDILPHLAELSEQNEKLSDLKVYSWVKHWDLISTVLNAFVGKLDETSDKFSVVGLDEYETNEYKYVRTNKLTDYLREKWLNIVNMRLIQNGIDPYFNQFETDDERQAYVQYVEQMQNEMTPAELQSWLSNTWESTGVKLGKTILDYDRERFSFDELDADDFMNLLAAGKCFRHRLVGYDYYKAESWSPKNTFYSKSLDLRYPQYGSYVGRVHYYTADQIISRWGHLLNAKQKKDLLGGTNWFHNSHGGETYELYKNGLIPQYESRYVPFEGFDDYNTITQVQDLTGIPMGQRHVIGDDGKEKVYSVFFPDLNESRVKSNAYLLSDDDTIRTDLYQVTEAYWISYQQIYFITYESESGLVTQEIVTDELLSDFLTENGIKKLKRTMKDATEDPEVNTYIVDYIPETRYGVKISGAQLKDESIYLDCQPTEYQIHGEGDLYDVVLPVSGYIGDSLVKKIYPWQGIYNLAINDLWNKMEKEIGKFFLFDINLIPTEYKQWGDTADAYFHMMNAAKQDQNFGVDLSKSNIAGSGGTPFNQFAVYNMSLSEEMKTRIEIAEWAKNKMYEQIGLTNQILNTPSKYTTNDGINQGYSAGLALMMPYYNNFDSFKKRDLEIHLTVAQYCMKNNKDKDIIYRNSDLELSFLEMSDEDFPLKRLGIKVITNQKKKKSLEELKRYLLSLNTVGSDVLDAAKLYCADSFVELKQYGREYRERQDQLNNRAHQQQMELIQQQAQIEGRNEEIEHERKKEIEAQKGEIEIQKAYINAAGRTAGYKNSDADSFEFIREVGRNTLEQHKIDSEERINDRRLDLSEKELELKAAAEAEDRKIKLAQIQQRDRRDATNRYTSEINKA